MRGRIISHCPNSSFPDSATCIITGTERERYRGHQYWTVEINTVTSFANEFEITDDGVLAKDKAAEMLERYPTLNANPYALLVKV